MFLHGSRKVMKIDPDYDASKFMVPHDLQKPRDIRVAFCLIPAFKFTSEILAVGGVENIDWLATRRDLSLVHVPVLGPCPPDLRLRHITADRNHGGASMNAGLIHKNLKHDHPSIHRSIRDGGRHDADAGVSRHDYGHNDGGCETRAGPDRQLHEKYSSWLWPPWLVGSPGQDNRRERGDGRLRRLRVQPRQQE